MNNQVIPPLGIKAIIGLGNPGPAYSYTRHNIGFLIVDALADEQMCSWQDKQNMQICSTMIADHKILLIKPQTFMNNSGQVLGFLAKQGIKQENILVVHDELELPFGTIKFKFDGSAKGHNGLKSIMNFGGSRFLRLRFGIDRPVDRDQVPDYVLAPFPQSSTLLDEKIIQACSMIDDLLSKK